ncbi:DUF4065 domain-containing protein [[Clostridium] innocuum]|nr:DUF4065 domain-containing protein [[Clostridium] innocuum]MCR0349327.1 DUF4065 domain-containing protein [[Clostridium] innocuum]RJV87127.1 DUF4065 domain-containing protein [Erysipelotrichaceae bacterium AF15-26LB]
MGEVNVFDVAKYILHKNGPISTMKLQKLCYYAQSWSLAWDETPLFKEDFQAWANGPVCPELFHRHRGLYSVDEKLFKDADIGKFNDEQKETIDSVLDYYGEKNPQWLSELTHSELPWKLTRGDTPPGDFCNRVIEKELMQSYYGGLNGE